MNRTTISMLAIWVLFAGSAGIIVACGGDGDSGGESVMLDDYNMVNDTSAPLDTETSPSKPTQPTKPTDDGGSVFDTSDRLIPPVSQGVYPMRGKCYDHEKGGTEGDGSGCYGIATRTLCQADAAACEANAACRDIDACQATCNDLSGDAWQTCFNDCKTSNAAGLRPFEAYYRCIYCSACATDCWAAAGDKDCTLTPGGCVQPYKTKCYGDEPDGSPGCWGCAIGAECKSEANACIASADCNNLEKCLAPCYSGPSAERAACTDACKATHADGAVLLDAYHYCIYCTAGCNTVGECVGEGPACL